MDPILFGGLILGMCIAAGLGIGIGLALLFERL